jgi:hypothetical protein
MYVFFFLFIYEKGRHYLILSLISKQNLLINSGTLHFNVNLCTAACNTNNGKILCLRLKLTRC